MALDDKTRKKIVADYIECQNYREVARKYGVHHSTVKRIAEERDSEEIIQKATQKKEENTQSVLEYMGTQAQRTKGLLDKLLTAMEDKAGALDMFTNIRDLATAYGIVVDKELKFAEMKYLTAGRHQKSEVDGLSRSLMELAGELDGD